MTELRMIFLRNWLRAFPRHPQDQHHANLLAHRECMEILALEANYDVLILRKR